MLPEEAYRVTRGPEPEDAMGIDRGGIERNKQVARDFVAALGRADADAIADSFAEDGTSWTLGTLPFSGVHRADEIRQLAKDILHAFPKGLRFTIRSLTAEDDRVSIEAESDGIHASGKRYRNTYHFLMRVRDGKIVEWREYLDTMHAKDVLCKGM
jgi:ketosteroid isomerase-like protein